MIYVDSREKARAIKKIIAHFDEKGIKWATTKSYVGDYVALDNARLSIDRKQNLTEVYGNIINDHVRFRKELVRAKDAGIKLVILVEHGGNIANLQDVADWKNPRRFLYQKSVREKLETLGIIREKSELECEELYGLCKQNKIKVFKPPIKSEQLLECMTTMSEKYDIIWNFCDKKDTGRRIVEILGIEST